MAIQMQEDHGNPTLKAVLALVVAVLTVRGIHGISTITSTPIYDKC
jgi:hypothetical protein